MGLFKKKQHEQEPTDEELTFFSVSEAQEFRSMVRVVFAELGYEVQINADHALDADGRGFGFWNVAANCHNAAASEWREIIRQHLQRVFASFDGADPFDELTAEQASSQTYARLYEESGLPNLDAYPHSQFAPGIVEMLALDLPDTVAVYARKQADTFGGWHALRSQGLTNLRALEHEQVETVPGQGGSSFTALLGESVYTASKALLLPGIATELTGKQPRQDLGWLMSIPNRHQLVWHVIENESVLGALDGMVRFTAMGYSDAPGPVSPHVYWWNGTGYEQLTRLSEEDGSLSIHVSPEFHAVLETATSGE
ncbi:hypothetical protein ACIQC5_11535 [Paenarthrobacter sp. NPDC092416]|uniref:hypothetical protein n=1 Tax=Paenarthrobacter sp. NPDC092416 TaxID=3364386 RepID=UPI00382B3E66